MNLVFGIETLSSCIEIIQRNLDLVESYSFSLIVDHGVASICIIRSKIHFPRLLLIGFYLGHGDREAIELYLHHKYGFSSLDTYSEPNLIKAII